MACRLVRAVARDGYLSRGQSPLACGPAQGRRDSVTGVIVLTGIAGLAEARTWLERYGCWALAAALFAETLLFSSVFVPGEALLLAAGYLVGAGVLPALPTVLAAWAGAVLGDQASFLLGSRMGERLLSKQPELRNRIHEALQAESSWLVVTYHFVALFRSWLPVVAGSVSFDPWRWVALDVVGVLAWVSILMFVGYLMQAAFGAEGPWPAGIAVVSGLILAGATWRLGWRLRQRIRLTASAPARQSGPD